MKLRRRCYTTIYEVAIADQLALLRNHLPIDQYPFCCPPLPTFRQVDIPRSQTTSTRVSLELSAAANQRWGISFQTVKTRTFSGRRGSSEPKRNYLLLVLTLCCGISCRIQREPRLLQPRLTLSCCPHPSAPMAQITEAQCPSILSRLNSSQPWQAIVRQLWQYPAFSPMQEFPCRHETHLLMMYPYIKFQIRMMTAAWWAPLAVGHSPRVQTTITLFLPVAKFKIT